MATLMRMRKQASVASMSRDYTKLRAFQLADSLVVGIYKETRAFPVEERFGLQSQIRRAAISMAANLVEGSARRGNTEYLNFCNISCASAFEVRYLIDLSFRLAFLPSSAHADLMPRLTHLCKTLVNLVIALERLERRTP
ncbi:MAG TPA: four helix bundle protein [Vicinamibacterales bacterium]|nr:four helix bundle protein [Vicinamibacterales bacterium]